MDNVGILLVGEVGVDFTIGTASSPAKMRLGGVVHAARALWACGVKYSAAVVLPSYLVDDTVNYLLRHGCDKVEVIGVVNGAPNVFLIGDVREVGDQGYENILRDAKKVVDVDAFPNLKRFSEIVIFPGSFNLANILGSLSPTANITIDIAYDVDDLTEIAAAGVKLKNIVISTSSGLFEDLASTDLTPLKAACRVLGADYLLLKENRGGSRLFKLETEEIENIPAVLSETMNSVGVGDAYTAVFASLQSSGESEAAWRGMQVATRYAQTTFPDDFFRDVQRDLMVKIDDVRSLGGTILPWHDRPQFSIYLAAPDFSYEYNPEIEAAVSALKYHNFLVRRPIIENGEASRELSADALLPYYHKDLEMIAECQIIFAVPLRRDPGTLVEIGIGLARCLPVITFDPRRENENTMIMCGSAVYSADLDQCINGVFEQISRLRHGIK